jgi:serine/threonine protein kinase
MFRRAKENRCFKLACSPNLDGKQTIDVTAESFEYHERLGTGSFGVVYRVTLQRTGEDLALKVLRRKHDLKYVLSERDILSTMQHPYILSLRYAFQHGGSLALVLPFCPHGNLLELVCRRRRLSLALATHYLAQLTLAVTHLHDKGIIHRDLKPENVLIDEDSQAVLSDFGLAKAHAAEELNTSCVGSVSYVAPEVLWGGGYDRLVDVYGLGITLYIILAGKPPFSAPRKEVVWHHIKWGVFDIPKSLPAEAIAFIKATMCRNLAERLGASATCELWLHPFFKRVDFDAVLRREVPCPEPCEAHVRHRAGAPPTRCLEEVYGCRLQDCRALRCLAPRALGGWDFQAGAARRDGCGGASKPELCECSTNTLPSVNAPESHPEIWEF